MAARAVIGLPGPFGRLQAQLMSLALGEPLMSIDNIDWMQVPNIASGALTGPARAASLSCAVGINRAAAAA